LGETFERLNKKEIAVKVQTKYVDFLPVGTASLGLNVDFLMIQEEEMSK